MSWSTEGKRCYSFEEIQALENRLEVLEDTVKSLNKILFDHIQICIEKQNFLRSSRGNHESLP